MLGSLSVTVSLCPTDSSCPKPSLNTRLTVTKYEDDVKFKYNVCRKSRLHLLPSNLIYGDTETVADDEVLLLKFSPFGQTLV